MILTGPKIAKEVYKGNIIIEPFNIKQLNPNSYNFKLGDTIKIYNQTLLNPKKKLEYHTIKLGKEGLVLEANKLYLGHIKERIGSNIYVPIMHGRSSTGRLGLFINITADLIDQGAFGQWTLQLFATQSIRIYPDMLIGQMTFWKPKGEALLYNGKYQNAQGPGESKSYKDF